METKDISEIVGIPNVVLSKDGRLWKNGVEKKISLNVSGYPVTAFSVKNKTKLFYIHQLLLKAFVRMPNRGEECLHINGIKNDCRLENLRWGTRKENVADAIKHGTATVGERNGGARLSQDDANNIRLVKETYKLFNKQIANYYGVTSSTISRIIRNETYRSI
jgi:hypothetical protein